MLSSGAGLLSSAPGPNLFTASDSLRFLQLGKGGLHGDKSARGNPRFYLDTYVTNYRAYICVCVAASMGEFGG